MIRYTKYKSFLFLTNPTSFLFLRINFGGLVLTHAQPWVPLTNLMKFLFRLTQNESSLGESMNSLTQKIKELLTRVSPTLFVSASPSMSFPPSPTVPANTHRMKLDVPRFNGTDPRGWVFKIN